MNKKSLSKYSKWDFIWKFLLSKIQWYNRILILVLGLWFIDFLISINVACGWCISFVFFCMHALQPPNGTATCKAFNDKIFFVAEVIARRSHGWQLARLEIACVWWNNCVVGEVRSSTRHWGLGVGKMISMVPPL
jgi:hypothetical protein